jgi:hypothetical protein
MNAIASVGRDPKTVLESEPSSARVDARKKLIALSWLTQIRPQMGVAGSPSHGASASDDKEMDDMLIEAVVKTRGPELDALLEQYQSRTFLISVVREHGERMGGSPDPHPC